MLIRTILPLLLNPIPNHHKVVLTKHIAPQTYNSHPQPQHNQPEYNQPAQPQHPDTDQYRDHHAKYDTPLKNIQAVGVEIDRRQLREGR